MVCDGEWVWLVEWSWCGVWSGCIRLTTVIFGILLFNKLVTYFATWYLMKQQRIILLHVVDSRNQLERFSHFAKVPEFTAIDRFATPMNIINVYRISVWGKKRSCSVRLRDAPVNKKRK